MDTTITDPSFFTGGKAIFTTHNADGKHYTFQISTPSGEDSPFFVGLLTGPNNRSDYTYLGLYDPSDGSIRLTRKSRLREDSLPVKVVRWAIKVVREGKVGSLPEGYGIHHEGRCCACGRKLTTPESVRKGIGPVCEGRRR